jgi:hypothetical protein
MNQEEFIEIIKLLVRDASIEGVEKKWSNPPGRAPRKELIEISNWYNNLDESNRSKLLLAVKDAVHHSIFGFLTILDDVTKSTEKEGRYELYFVTPDKKYLLNDPNEEYLHDIYNSL